MRFSKEEIDEELEHKRKILNALVRRRRPLELQAAQRGIDTHPEVITEIGALNEQIRTQEEEIARLESLAAEGQLTLAEAEYRLLLAETWDTASGRPNIAGYARLELTRLELGLTPEKAAELEHEVRAALVKEIFQTLDISPLFGGQRGTPVSMGDVAITISVEGEGQIHINQVSVDQNLVVSNPLESTLKQIGKAIRLDSSITLQLLLLILPPEGELNITEFQRLLFAENRILVNQDEQPVFVNFVEDFSGRLKNRLLPGA